MKRIIIILTLLFLGSLYSANADGGLIVDEMTPNFGFPGTIVEIKGQNFDPIAENNMIYFGKLETRADSIYTKDANLIIRAIVPDGIQTCEVRVKSGSGEVTLDDKFYAYETELSSNGIIFMILGFIFVLSLTFFSIFKVLSSKRKLT